MRIEYSIDISKDELAELLASITTMVTVILREIERPHSCDPTDPGFDQDPNRDIKG